MNTISKFILSFIVLCISINAYASNNGGSISSSANVDTLRYNIRQVIWNSHWYYTMDINTKSRVKYFEAYCSSKSNDYVCREIEELYNESLTFDAMDEVANEIDKLSCYLGYENEALFWELVEEVLLDWDCNGKEKLKAFVKMKKGMYNLENRGYAYYQDGIVIYKS